MLLCQLTTGQQAERIQRVTRRIRVGLVGCLAAILAHHSMATSTEQQLDDLYQQISHDLYRQLAPRLTLQVGTLPELAEALAASHTRNLPETVMLIRANQPLLQKNYTTDAFWQALTLLYQANDTATAQQFVHFIERQKNPRALSRSHFLMARYYEQRGNWAGVVAALSHVNGAALPAIDAQYAVFLQGLALQSQKKHRKAANFYETVPPGSPWYAHAKLNEGIAYMRQGWWTESHLEIDKALKSLDPNDPDSDLKNRLLVVLGFSQIHFEFYRNARETLHGVDLDSPHTNKALLGLGLAAAHQNDFRGALNAFTRLTGQPVNDTSVDEAWLLVPHVLEELGEIERAAEAYEQARQYYIKRLATLTHARTGIETGASGRMAQVLAENEDRAAVIFDNPAPVPAHLLKNYRHLQILKVLAQQHAIKVSLVPVEKKYEEWLAQKLLDSIAARTRALESYLSQAKYGIATLYDQ